MSEDRQDLVPTTKTGLLITISTVNDTTGTMAALPIKRSSPRRRRSVSDQSWNGSATESPKVQFTYNDYGELVDVEELKRPVNSSDLTVTETLRLILRAYHNQFRTKMESVLALQLSGAFPGGDDNQWAYFGVLFLWDFTPKTPKDMPPNVLNDLCVYRGPPKVLEIGCGDGKWCFKVKEAHPDWIVEGLDDLDYWCHCKPGKKFRDFMESDGVLEETSYFSRVHLVQNDVKFTVRNINALLSHSNPIPCHKYSLIRAKDVFGKLESYMGFLEDVRRILKPEGVVEFIDFDPRPRVCLAKRRRSTNDDHVSRAQTDWTDNIVDRFKDPYDEQLAATVPEWAQRVEERHKATLRPKDGIPAPHLKSWLEGAGFWDMKELVMRLPVGGDSPAGKQLLEYMKYQIDLENFIPLLATELPQPNLDEIKFGNFYINMHIVSGRKPRDPRTGDLLRDGTRHGMTLPITTTTTKSSVDMLRRVCSETPTHDHQWTRATLDARLATMTRSQMRSRLNVPQGDGVQERLLGSRSWRGRRGKSGRTTE